MSDWSSDDSQSKVVPLRGPRNKERRIVPCLTLRDGDSAEVEDYLRSLREGNGQVLAPIIKLIRDQGFNAIDAVTVIRNEDATPRYIEIRYAATRPAQQQKKAPKKVKGYRIIYRGVVSGSDDPHEDGVRLCAGFSELGHAGLFVPTNSNELLAAVSDYRAGQGLRPAILWTEGEKTRLGLAQRLDRADASKLFTVQGLRPVTAATLSGASGVRHTNYALRPSNATCVQNGRNDSKLDLAACRHYVIVDADRAGEEEGRALVSRLDLEHKVAAEDICWVEPPAGVTGAWDDADSLPLGVSDMDRVEQIIASIPYRRRWVYVDRKNGEREVDVSDVRNRRRALSATVSSVTYDYAVASYQIKLNNSYKWLDSELRDSDTASLALKSAHCPDESELMWMAEMALDVMGHRPNIALLNSAEWRRVLESLCGSDNRIDSIYNETMMLVAQGQEVLDDANKPDRLLTEMFGLPYGDEYIRLASEHLVRDMLALRLRPSFNNPPIVPQLLYVLYGAEGAGKSTAVKVLAGGDPSVDECARFSDSASLRDLDSSSNYGHYPLYSKIAGCTAIELADKSLGTDMSRSRADVLKHFANMGQINFRTPYSRDWQNYNLRAVRIFTTNNPDILHEDMGSRRWIIIDLTKSLWPARAALRQRPCDELSAHERELVAGRNPGLVWVHANLPAILAHAYNEGSWRGSLQLSERLAALIGDTGIQHAYKAAENWEYVMRHDIEQLAEQDEGYNAIFTHNLSNYVTDKFGLRAPAPQRYGPVLISMGWIKHYQYFPETKKQENIWHKKGIDPRFATYARWTEGCWGPQLTRNEVEESRDGVPF